MMNIPLCSTGQHLLTTEKKTHAAKKNQMQKLHFKAFRRRKYLNKCFYDKKYEKKLQQKLAQIF